mgnify:CR=1 FL=1
MTSLAASGQPSATQTTGKVVHPVWVRVCHWTNVVAMVVMVMSGWQIYNASPLFNFVFPPTVTLGGWLGGGLLWHFAAMWLLRVPREEALMRQTFGDAYDEYCRRTGRLLPKLSQPAAS